MWLATINFLHFAALLFVLSTAVLVAVSYATPAPAKEKVADLTVQTEVVTPAGAEPRTEWRVNLAGSVVLAAVIGTLWVVFR